MSISHASSVIRQVSDNKCRRQKKKQCPIVSSEKKLKKITMKKYCGGGETDILLNDHSQKCKNVILM